MASPLANAIKSVVLLLVCAALAVCQPPQSGQKPKAADAGNAPEQKSSSPQTLPDKAAREKVADAPPKADKPAGPTLEGMLDSALRNNPDIRVAEAKLREAEAELNRIRLQVTQKLITLHNSIGAQKALVKEAEARLGATAIQGHAAAQSVLTQEKAKLAELEAQMPSLLGSLPSGTIASRLNRLWGTEDPREFGLLPPHDSRRIKSVAFSPDGRLLAVDNDSGSVQVWDVVPPQVIGEGMADKIRKALETPITIQYQDQTVAEIVKDLERKAPGIAFLTKFARTTKDNKLTLRCPEPILLGAAIQMIEDATDLQFAARDYGILVNDGHYDGFPEGAIPLQEVWKGRAGFERLKTDSSAKLSVPASEGSVTVVDPNTGTVTISIGSNAGLTKGDTCEVYRLKPEPKYLGTIEILAAKPSEAAAKPTTSARGTIQVGDRVTRNIRSR